MAALRRRPGNCIDTPRPHPLQFTPLANPPQRTSHRTHDARPLADSPEQEVWRKMGSRICGKHLPLHDLFSLRGMMNHHLTEYALRGCEGERHTPCFLFSRDNLEEEFFAKLDSPASSAGGKESAR